MLIGLLATTAWAAPVGEPLTQPETARVGLSYRYDIGSTLVTEDGCSESGQCGAVWNRRPAHLLEGRVALIEHVGIYGQVERTDEAVPQARYDGVALGWAAGIRADLPITRSLSAAGGVRYGRTTGLGSSLREGGSERSTRQVATASLLAVLGSPEAGVTAWLGGQGAFLHSALVEPFGGDVLDIALSPRDPLGAVLGFAITSDPLGGPWTRSVRVTVGGEGQAGLSNSAGFWFGVSY